MFLFSMGVTRGKWGTLVNTLCSFKRHYDANTPLAQVMPELVEQYPDTYANMGIHDLGDTMFAWLKRKQPWRTVERSLFRPAGGGSHPA